VRLRRWLVPIASATAYTQAEPISMAPLIRELLANYAATGLQPAYCQRWGKP
jgi:hypothetical protein